MSALLSPSSLLRVSLSSLPRELLRQIVAEVHAQDLVFGRVRQVQPNRSRYGAWPVKARRATSPFELADVEVQWSYWYGKGLSALSYVNKQLRQLSLPLLVETVTPHQLEKPFAIYALPYSPIARMVKHLDLVLAERTETWSAAAALHLLPELERLSVSVELAQDIAHKRFSDESQSEHAAYARQAFARRSSHIRELSLFGTSWITSGPVLSSFTTIETLKVMSIGLRDSDPLTASRLREADVLGLCSLRLSDLRLASTFENDDDPDLPVPTVNPTWIARLCMPSLRSFSYSVGYEAPTGLFNLISHAFPCLEVLAVSSSFDPGPSLGPVDHPPVERVILPRLRRLSLAGIYCAYQTFTRRFFTKSHLPCLHWLELDWHHDGPSSLDIDGFFSTDEPLPPRLSSIRFRPIETSPAILPDLRRALVAWTRRHGIDTQIVPGPEPSHLDKRARSRFEGVLWCVPQDAVDEFERDAYASQAREVLEWGLGRVEGACAARDNVALAELADLCEPLLERWAIERA